MPTTLTATTSGASVVPAEAWSVRLVIANDGPARVHVAVGRPATLADTAIVPGMIAQIAYTQRGAALYALTENGTAALRISSPLIPGGDMSQMQPGPVLRELCATHGQTPDHPMPDPAVPRGVSPPNKLPLPSGRGNTAYNDDALVARAREIYSTMVKPSKHGAAQTAIAEYKQNNPSARLPAISEKALIERISRKI